MVGFAFADENPDPFIPIGAKEKFLIHAPIQLVISSPLGEKYLKWMLTEEFALIEIDSSDLFSSRNSRPIGEILLRDVAEANCRIKQRERAIQSMAQGLIICPD